jgi:GNAT superfamily N-acetyltransferase
MTSILHLRHPLLERPADMPVPGIAVRTFAGPADVDIWLDLRNRAFAREKVGVRAWDNSDFQAEFLSKPWWQPQRMWFAETAPTLLKSAQAVGTVTLAERRGADATVAVVHWLAVLSGWRRRGIGRLLLNVLHQAAWDAGYREVQLETHAGWTSAVRMYQGEGYVGKDEG